MNNLNNLNNSESNSQEAHGYWTEERDRKLIELVKFYGGKLSWNQLSVAFKGAKGRQLR